MNNAQDMSPDFVLMRLVSAAEDGRLDSENGNVQSGGTVAGKGKDALVNSAVKPALDISREPGLQRPCSLQNKGQSSETTAAADSGGTQGPKQTTQGSMGPQGFDFVPSPGLRPQLLVFSNIMRSGDLDRLPAPRDALEPSPAVNNNRPAGEEGPRDPMGQTPSAAQLPVPSAAEGPGAAELCHRFITTPNAWPLLADTSGPESCREQQEAVLELARRFGELGVGAVPRMLLKGAELPQCSCQGAQGAEPRDDPTETSDALLVLEGLGGRGMEEGPGEELDADDGHREFLLQRKREIIQKMSGAFSISSFQVELRTQMEEMGQPGTADPESSTQALTKTSTPVQNSPWTTSPNPSQSSTPRRAKRCTGGPRTPTYRTAGGDKTFKVPGKSKKNSLKTRLSKLFRTKSCSGSTHILDKRPSVSYSVSSAVSLVDMEGGSGAEQDADRSKFSPIPSPNITSHQSVFGYSGETVSLVDVDISLRGTNTPHPPTPPRRSLSLLDDISGPQPGPFLVSIVGASLQSLPLSHPPPPPPSQATIQHSLSLNDAFFRALPHSNSSSLGAVPPVRQAAPPVLCALRRSEASNFTASLRELEKCGWYWGPMNWEDAEVKLKGKLDGSFLVRDSSDPRYILSLSFRSQGVTHHTRMEHYRGTFSLWCHPKFEDRCHSVVEFIERAIMHSKNGKFLYFLRSRVPGLPPTPVQLLYPVSRFSNVKSLQHLCRFCIRQIVRIDHIQELPLPRSLISYLSKFYYYDPEEEMYLSINNIRRVVRSGQEANLQT
ncbi:PREDICTED: suppressor of cytokine signaling 7-like [Cyprinodon variegatus]|uniref:suppressor of cytokine signaling 7-like n=1 Tax=Cyprinodon variegatus TaxID=28743 RepID=UPI0007426CEF|nr:PREDICTED: suppressor of cytokine signaling 7-like [Cyprinodon variegatus]